MGLLDRWTKKAIKKQLADGAVSKADKKIVGQEVTGEVVSKISSKTDSVTPQVFLSTPSASLAYKVIVRPLVTEKSAHNESQNKYTFIIARSAKKPQVKQAVKALYGVDALAVNIVNVQGHRLRFGRSFGKRNDYKKAIVTLPVGKSITIHEGV